MEWDDLRHFSAFVRAGSLAGAARALGIEHATVARRIAALERRLNLKLVDRRGRRLILTAEGHMVAAQAARMSEMADAIGRTAIAARAELHGEVTISVPPAYAASVLAPRLVPLRRRYPMLSIRLLGESHATSLERREADIAVRLSRPQTGDLTAMRIGTVPFHLYASPGYLRHVPDDQRAFIGSAGAMAQSPQQAALTALADGRDEGLSSDTIEIQAAVAASGGGIAVLPEFLGDDRRGLVRLPLDAPVVTREIWLVVHSDLRDAAPIRVVMDALRAKTGSDAEPPHER